VEQPPSDAALAQEDISKNLAEEISALKAEVTRWKKEAEDAKYVPAQRMHCILL
jgi:hypothetical protein